MSRKNQGKNLPPMSLESSMQEEAGMVRDLIDQQHQYDLPIRSQSPYDVMKAHLMESGPLEQPRAHRSQSTNQTQPSYRSMLDVDGLSTPANGSLSSAGTNRNSNKPLSPTSLSFGGRNDSPHSRRATGPSMNDFNSRNYVSLTDGGSSRPLLAKRNIGPVKKSVMAEVMRGMDVNKIPIPRPGGGLSQERTRALSASRVSSQSPHNRLSLRSMSPAAPRMTGSRSSGTIPGTVPGPNTFMTKAGKVIDLNNVGQVLTAEKLHEKGLPVSEKSLQQAMNGESRMMADPCYNEKGEIMEMSDSDPADSSDEEENNRGRTKDRAITQAKPQVQKVRSLLDPEPEKPKDKPRRAESLLAAAEEERMEQARNKVANAAGPEPAANYQYRSLFDDPRITVTDTSGTKVTKLVSISKPLVPSSYDRSPSPRPIDSANNSDDEVQYDNIKTAQSLTVQMTPITSHGETPRTMRIIARGDYFNITRQCMENDSKPRKYLVATDLSDESSHALEWAIGTVMRDGDVLLAMCCVDEETGLAGPESNKSTLSNSNQSPVRKDRLKLPDERKWAVEEITNKVVRLLRKTKLQVRVMIEVIHCKIPKHTILEAIDMIQPELVILGSRGRSAIKGVILGSFSNYLVTKSSVPVMVARKRMRKSSKYRKTAVTTQVNVLRNPTVRSLANARAD